MPKPSKKILIGLALALVLAGAVFGWLRYGGSNKAKTDAPSFNSQTLSPEELARSTEGNATIDSTRTLTVNAGSVFAGNILANKDLTVNGKLSAKILELADLSVIGVTTLQNGLNAANFINLRGSLNVNGNGLFSGDLSANTITARSTFNSGSLVITGHIVTGGNSPTAANGNSVGAGGSVKVFGNDTAGTIVITTGSGPGIGTLATLTFRTPYTGSPRVNITPIGSTSARLESYVTRFLTFFSVATNSAPTPNTEYVFDYNVSQ